MTVAWDSSINTVRLTPISKTPYELRNVFQAIGGAPQLDPLSNARLYLVGFDVIFSGVELDAFWSWWIETLNKGSERFTGHLDVVSNAAAIYQFISMPQFNMLRAGGAATSRYRASFQLTQYG